MTYKLYRKKIDFDQVQRVSGFDCALCAYPWPPVLKDSIDRKICRAKILKRDGPNCCWCGVPLNTDASQAHNRFATIEHILPRSKGGTDDSKNLRLACRACNSSRGNHTEKADMNQALVKKIKNGLKATIDIHGAVTVDLIDAAAKNVASELYK